VCNPREDVAILPICPSCQALMLAHPQVLPGYRLVRELGRGGMGVVYLAVREHDGAVLAVKTVMPGLAGTSDLVDRFLREARVLEALDHPHIVTFRDMGEANGLLYFAMDYIRGIDAARLVAKTEPLGVDRAVGLIAQVLQALDYAHAKRFVHRDVKPANILITRRDGEEHACLADFGLARIYQASQISGLTATGVVGGTPAFMAPEQVTNYRDAKPAADQYAAAATLYTLLTGALTHNFAQSSYERLVQLLHDDPVPIQQRRPNLPDALADAIHRALARDSADRFPDARTFRRALLAAAG
jgi:serine/threonine-protein kinase